MIGHIVFYYVQQSNMKRLKNNRQGSILQIVLIVFLILTEGLAFTFALVVDNRKQASLACRMMEQNRLEIVLMRYYYDQLKDGILLSDEYSDSKYKINYTVDDLGHCYCVKTYVITPFDSYAFELEFDTDSYFVQKFTYFSTV